MEFTDRVDHARRYPAYRAWIAAVELAYSLCCEMNEIVGLGGRIRTKRRVSGVIGTDVH